MDKKERDHIKSLVYEQFAQVGKAFSNSRRLEVIDLLAQGPHTVEQLAQSTGMSVASTSQHLQVLKSAKLADVRREGTYAWYYLSGDKAFAIWKAMREFALDERSEISKVLHDHFEDRYTLKQISAQELLAIMQSEKIILLDVRPKNEYENGHLPGAINIPLDELETSLEIFPDDAHIIAYCRASYCLLSDQAAVILKNRGYRVEVYKDGFPEWRIQGFPYEVNHPDGEK